MNKISLYKINVGYSRSIVRYGKAKSIGVDGGATSRTRKGISLGREALFPYALPRCSAEGRRSFSSQGRCTDGHEFCIRERLGEAIHSGRHQRSEYTFWSWPEAYHGLLGRRICSSCHRAGQAMREQGKSSLGTGNRQRGERCDLQTFFISIGARYKRIRKRPRGVPSPQLYEYKVEKLQELERQAGEGRITLYYADESHTCTEGYVPYGWQLNGEDVFVPSQRVARLNIFGMITRDNQYEGFTTTERMTADKIVSFLDDFSFRVRKKTFVVLDNATVHRNKWIKELRPIWENRGLFLFFLPPYSPHLNIAETLWRILKGKWIRPQDYTSTDMLFYATNRALADIGNGLRINYAKHAA